MTRPQASDPQEFDDKTAELANAVMGRTLAIAEFTALGDVAGRLVEDAWSGSFLDRSQRNRLLAGLPNADPEFDAFVAASGADRRNAPSLRDGWFDTWLRGYFLGLARLHRENDELGRFPKHIWQYPPAERFYGTYRALGRLGGGSDPERKQREMGWLGYGALAPWTSSVIHGALAFVSSQQDEVMLSLYPVGAARVRAMYSLWVVASDGYAIARAQQELEVMNSFLAGLPRRQDVDPASST